MKNLFIFLILIPLYGHASTYDLCIQHLKKSESLKLERYLCPSNAETIGYGHRIKPGESFTTITENVADSLLKSDFDACVRFISKKHPTISHRKKLSLACFVFNLGAGAYLKSSIYTKVLNNESVVNKLLEYQYYTSHGKKIKSSHLLKSRMFEASLCIEAPTKPEYLNKPLKKVSMLKIIITVPIKYLEVLFSELNTLVKSSAGKMSDGQCKLVIEPADNKEEEAIRILKKYSNVKDDSEDSQPKI